MKKHIVLVLLTIACVLCLVLGVVACDNNVEHGKTDEFIRVMDGVFASAGYVSAGSARSTAANSQRRIRHSASDNQKPGSDNQKPGDDNRTENTSVDSLYEALRTVDNTDVLTNAKLKVAKNEVLYQGANIAALFKSMAQVFGDEVFSTLYDLSKLDMPDTILKLETAQSYTLYGGTTTGKSVPSVIQMDFKEYETGKFIFKLVQYSYLNNRAELRFSYYDSSRFVFVADLEADESFDFANYESAYGDFRVTKCTMAIYGNNEYISSSTDSETIMRFAYDTLGFSNQTYAKLLSLGNGKSLNDKNVDALYAAMSKNYYTTQSSGGNNEIEEIYIPEAITLRENEIEILEPTFSPSTITDAELTWESTDPKVAIVSEDGRVVAMSVGTTSIVVTAPNGKTAVCVVTVIERGYDISPKKISLDKQELNLDIGDTYTLDVIFEPSSATTKLTWETLNDDVALVNDEGLVTAIAEGTAVIRVTTDNKLSAECTVTVKVPQQVIPIESITLDNSFLALQVGDQATLIAAIFPVSASNHTIHWSSSNEAVATVDNGVITAHAIGTTTITAEVDGQAAACTVEVQRKYIWVEKIEVEPSTITIAVGETAKINVVITPDNATDKKVSYKSVNKNVAVVDGFGYVTGVAEGETSVVVEQSPVRATCKIIVVAPQPTIEVTDITLDQTSMSVIIGEEFTLKATIFPEDATNKTIKWSSSNWNYCYVDDNGNVSATACGTATITATTANGLSASCVVEVKPDMPILAESVTLDKTELTLDIWNSETLIATVYPEDAINKNVTWSSSDESVATVDSLGNVTAVGVGTTTITVKTSTWKTATCTVTVTAKDIPITSIMLDVAELNLLTGDYHALGATVQPTNATEQIQWSSTDDNVLTVNQSGVIYANHSGQATITASASQCNAYCVVTVKPKPQAIESITITEALTLQVGGYDYIYASYEPSYIVSDDLTFISMDEDVAMVAPNGLVSAVAEGQTSIQVTTSNGITAICNVTVIPKTITIQEIGLDNITLHLNVGDCRVLFALIFPSDATDKTITWSSSDTAVATVESDGSVTGVGDGTAIITATTSNNLSATCTVTVHAIPATSIQVNPTTLALKIEDTFTVKVNVLPEDTTDTVTWISSTPDIADVDSNGTVTAHQEGSCTITVTTTSGQSATLPVTVSPRTIDDILEFVELHNSNGTISGYAVAGLRDKTQTDIVIPEQYNGKEVRIISANAFKGTRIRSIYLPQSVCIIQDSAFANCTALRTAYIGMLGEISNSTTFIVSRNAFENTYIETLTASVYMTAYIPKQNLKTLTIIGDGIAIGNHFLLQCTMLTHITLPEHIDYFRDYSFACTTLKTIVYNGTVAQWEAITKWSTWNATTGEYIVICTDATLDKNGNIIEAAATNN